VPDAAPHHRGPRGGRRRVDALAVVSVDHARVAEEIQRLHRQGIPTFTLLSDVSASLRAGYFGLDARKAGRTAARAITRFAQKAWSGCDLRRQPLLPRSRHP
jgi:ABC-type sugar transport system substrate-binding protein